MKKPPTRRAWNSTLPAPTAPIARSPLRQTRTPTARKPIRPKKRRTAAEERAKHEREYGPPGRVEFVNSLPCLVGVLCAGKMENAHVGKEGKGVGRKAHYTQIVPLCTGHHDACHHGQQTFARAWNLDLAACQAETQRLWLAHLAESAA